jgi:hypothetical protein
MPKPNIYHGSGWAYECMAPTGYPIEKVNENLWQFKCQWIRPLATWVKQQPRPIGEHVIRNIANHFVLWPELTSIFDEVHVGRIQAIDEANKLFTVRHDIKRSDPYYLSVVLALELADTNLVTLMEAFRMFIRACRTEPADVAFHDMKNSLLVGKFMNA